MYLFCLSSFYRVSPPIAEPPPKAANRRVNHRRSASSSPRTVTTARGLVTLTRFCLAPAEVSLFVPGNYRALNTGPWLSQPAEEFEQHRPPRRLAGHAGGMHGDRHR